MLITIIEHLVRILLLQFLVDLAGDVALGGCFVVDEAEEARLIIRTVLVYLLILIDIKLLKWFKTFLGRVIDENIRAVCQVGVFVVLMLLGLSALHLHFQVDGLVVCELTQVDVEAAALEVLLTVDVSLASILLERQLRELAQLAVGDLVPTLALVAAIDLLAEVAEVSEFGLMVSLLDGVVHRGVLILLVDIGDAEEIP